MAITHLSVHNFRNLTQLHLDFHPKFNFILGNNGSGKTSLLEALFFIAHGRSFKSAVANRIISYEQPHFTLHAKIHEQERNWSVGLQKIRQGNTLIKINDEQGNKLSDIAKLLPIQMITPEGLNLVNGGPAYRRAYLDWGLFHYQPQFYLLWNNLRRLLKQRNMALSTALHYSDIQIWDRPLVEVAEKVTSLRKEYATILQQAIVRTCALFLPELELKINFYTGWEKDTPYDMILQRNFQRDKELGYTFSGPQKADLRFRLQGLPAEDVLSRGQLKLLMCALRLAQGEHLMAHSQRHCIFLIDDFASELDHQKRQLLAQRLKQSEAQIFISAIHCHQLDAMFPTINSQDYHAFYLANGQYTPHKNDTFKKS